MTNIQEIQDKIENQQNHINTAMAQGDFVSEIAKWRKELNEIIKELTDNAYTYE